MRVQGSDREREKVLEGSRGGRGHIQWAWRRGCQTQILGGFSVEGVEGKEKGRRKRTTSLKSPTRGSSPG